MPLLSDREGFDREALHRALVALGTCPKCRRPLRPIYTGEPGVLACVTCDRAYCEDGTEVR
jgi:uncharacterized protein YbaR (Trm112 family)